MNSPIVDVDVTIVIPTLGREILEKVLESILSGHVLPQRVIVVDQGRTASVAALLERASARGLQVLYLPSTRKGRSAGLNDGLDQVATRYVAITDDDCVVAPDWISRLGARLRRHKGAIITGRVDAGEGEAQLAVTTSAYEDIQVEPRLKFDRLSGGNMALAVALAREIGPFTENAAMRTAEDGEYAYRALRLGAPIVYAPEVIVEHLGWRDNAQRVEQYRSYALSQGGFYGAYIRQGDGFIALRAVVHLLRSGRRWVLGTLRGDTEAAQLGKAYVLGLLPGLQAGWRSLRRKT